MGQYYLTVNVDKKQYICPHAFGSGMKLMEFGNDSSGLLTGLAVLLSDGCGQGGGDLHINSESELAGVCESVIGSWAGDRIVVAGDYGNVKVKGIRFSKKLSNIYDYAQERFQDISVETLATIMQDGYICSTILEGFKHYAGRGQNYSGFRDYVAYVWQISKYMPTFRAEILDIYNDFGKVADSNEDDTFFARERLKILIESNNLLPIG